MISTPILKEIPHLFDHVHFLQYEKRFKYYGWDEDGKPIYEDRGFGWYYPGEPEKGYHGW